VNLQPLWQVFSDCVLEDVIPCTSRFIVYADGAVGLETSDGQCYKFTSADMLRDWLLNRQASVWEEKRTTVSSSTSRHLDTALI
jgi:hypothetical protein